MDSSPSVHIERKELQQVEPVKVLESGVKKEAFAQDIFPHNVHQNILLVARKGSGKTNLIYDILRRYLRDVGPSRLRVLIFSPTADLDPTWQQIQEFLTENGVRYTTNDSFYTTGPSGRRTNILSEFASMARPNSGHLYVIITDDMAFDARSRVLASQMLRNRHYDAVTVTASQVPQHVDPSVYTNADFIVLLKGIVDLGLDFIHKRAALPISKEAFRELYHEVTKEPYSFLWVNNSKTDATFRHNFDTELTVSADKRDGPKRKKAEPAAPPAKRARTKE